MCPLNALDLKFRTPAGFMVCGLTMSGKTRFVSELKQNFGKMFNEVLDHVVYCYGEWQLEFNRFSQRVKFVKGLQPILDDEICFTVDSPSLLVMDDLALSACNDSRAPVYSLSVFTIENSRSY